MLMKLFERIDAGDLNTPLIVAGGVIVLLIVAVQAGIWQGRKMQLNDDIKLVNEAREAVAQADARAQRISDILTVAYDALDWRNEQHRRLLCAWAVSKGYSTKKECYQKGKSVKLEGKREGR